MAALAHLLTHGPSTPTQIARVVQISTPSVTQLLDRLTRAGLVIRNPHPTDRRKLLIGLTIAGHAAAQHVQAPVAAALARSASTLTADDHTTFLRFLRAAAVELAALPQPAPQPDPPITGSGSDQSAPPPAEWRIGGSTEQP